MLMKDDADTFLKDSEISNWRTVWFSYKENVKKSTFTNLEQNRLA